MSDTRFVNQRMVGSSVIPDEAIPLVEGDGRFLNDIKLPGMYHVAFLRSQHAHARLNSVDVSEARKLPGIIKVLTGKELLGKVDPFRSMPNRFSGGESVQHWLAVDKVRFCGEAICAVVAEDRATAEDACDLIKVDYDPLPVVTDPRLGELDDSPLVHDSCPNNYLIKREYQRGEVDEAFRNAHAVVKRKFKIGRKQALCLEGRGCVAGYRENTFTLTVWMSHQLPYVVRHYLAKHLRLAETDVRVIIPHTGGGFGQKASIYPEEFVCAHLALTLRRPVKWVEDRIENMVASTHARDQYIELELAADRDGRILATQLRYLGRCRRLLHLSLVGRHGAAADRGPDARSLQDRGDALPDPGRRHQQDAGRSLSRGGSPVGIGVAGIADRRDGASFEARSGGGAPAQPHSDRGDALSQRQQSRA